MIDGIIKADGTSRLMRATLPATYEEFKARAAAGTLPLDVLFNADGWNQFPTFLNKGNLLKDATAGVFGMDASAVPDDVFAFVGKYNEHWWSVLHGLASVTYKEAKSAISSQVFINNYGTAATIRYADSVSVDPKDGTVTLNNPTTVVISASTGGINEGRNLAAMLPGKYVLGAYTFTNEILYLPASLSLNMALYNSNTGYSLYTNAGDTLYKVVAQIVNIPAGETTYEHSIDRNAFPDSGTVDGLTYQYLGIPFDNAVTAPKIATGSYTGTDTYGKNNPNSLTFEFEPKLLVISAVYNNNTAGCIAVIVPGLCGSYSSQGLGDKASSYVNILGSGKSGNTVTWWSNWNSGTQLNASTVTYNYIAIG